VTDKEEMQRFADDPQSGLRRAELDRSNELIRKIVESQAVRKFCVEQAITAMRGANAKEIQAFTEWLYAFMTAERS
jgi:hypothetical protein